MRLSPGRQLTVIATPHAGMPDGLVIPESMKWKRPMASAALELGTSSKAGHQLGARSGEARHDAKAQASGLLHPLARLITVLVPGRLLPSCLLLTAGPILNGANPILIVGADPDSYDAAVSGPGQPGARRRVEEALPRPLRK